MDFGALLQNLFRQKHYLKNVTDLRKALAKYVY